MAQIGRIGGPLLEDNLLRNGVDLAFRNDSGSTQLLYIDIANGRIGVNNASPTHKLYVDGTTRTTNLISESPRLANFDISNSTFSAVGNIELNASEAIVAPAISNDVILINENYISTTQSNANIDLTPNGTGETSVINNLNVYGSLYTQGNITLDGTIIFGNTDTDIVDFNADVNSDIIPNLSNVYSLGSITKRWDNLYTNQINGQSVSTNALSVSGIDFNKSQGNIIYVAQNGNDTNRGDHIFAPVSSIRRALELVDASVGGPTVVYVAPGVYQEILPLVVSSNVSIIGESIRSVTITPAAGSETQDVFQLNGETTIARLTVKDFFYDSINNTGYAFRFAPNAVISSRSPYIQDVSVITKGSVITVNDPQGFNQGDAGRGAWIDGAELNSSSIEASMLFHSCTFITPNADTITMTNGVRVEWLNSFTYFANRGLYAVRGTVGRTSQDGSTVTYGAELRSIGSANVYGNYGAVADGADCLMYLIQHNFAYIGSGLDSSNDNSITIQANEVTEQNSGQIHYVTTDHTGAFRVGENFFIDFETGSTSVDLSSFTASSLNGLVVTTNDDRTFITGEKIETGNVRVSGNLIETVVGNLNLDSATGELNLNNSSSISGNLDVIGNLTFGGNLNLLGNQISDTLKFNVDLDQDLSPNQTLIYNLGASDRAWLDASVSEAILDNIKIYTNVIETTQSNSDLELGANGIGIVELNNNTIINNELTVSNLLSTEDITVNGNITLTGIINLSGSSTIGESLTVGADISVSQISNFEEITIDDNFITTTSSNTDLDLRADGTGTVKLLNPTSFNNNLTVENFTTNSNFTVNNDITFNIADISSIKIENNSITTTTSNADLELRAPALSSIVAQNTVLLAQNLSVNDTSYFNNIVLVGDISQSGPRTINGNYTLSDNLIVDSIIVNDNFISTTDSNSDLELRANGTGSVTMLETFISNDLTVGTTSYLQDTTVEGTLTHTGNKTQFGDYYQTGDLNLDGILTVGSKAQFENIAIDGNTVKSTISNSNLELRASGIGRVLVPSNNVQINNNLFVSSIIAGNIVIDADILLNEIVIPPSIIEIDDNFITTTISNADLELRASNLGELVFNNNTLVNQQLAVSGNSSLKDVSINGELIHVGNLAQTGDVSITNKLSVTGVSKFDSAVQLENILVSQNILQTTTSNSDLELRANGTGSVLISNNNVGILQNTLVGQVFSNNITVSDTVSFDVMNASTDIQIFDNVITTTNSNSNLELRANGAGSVIVKDLYFNDSKIQTLLSNITFSAPVVDINSVGSLKIPVGSTPPLNLGTVKFNTSSGFFEGKSNQLVTLSGLYSTDRRTSVLAHPTNNTINLTVNNSVVGTVSTTGLTIHEIQVNNINLKSNSISITSPNTSLALTAPGTGSVVIGNFGITDNFIENNSPGLLTFSNTSFGKVKFNGSALAIPAGTTAERPVNPPVGDTRWNTTTTILETWDGNQYITAAGTSEVIGEEEFNDLLLEYTLIFG